MPTPLTVPDMSKGKEDLLVAATGFKTSHKSANAGPAVSASPASAVPPAPISAEVSEELERLSRIRARTLKFKEDSEKVFTFINKGEHLELIAFLQREPEVKVQALYDDRGYTTLHLAAFRNNDKIVTLLLETVAGRLESASDMKAWVNKKTAKEGFTALHFGSFRGNVNMIRALIKYNADYRALNFYGLNVMHVAAQGDQPVSLVNKGHLGIFQGEGGALPGQRQALLHPTPLGLLLWLRDSGCLSTELGLGRQYQRLRGTHPPPPRSARRLRY